MPRVPTYDVPQAELAPLRTPNLDSVVTPGLLDAPARSRMALGESLIRAGRGLTDAALQIQERENADMVFRAETGIKDDWLQYEQEARQRRQGRFAKDLTKDTNDWWAERIQHHLGTLKNEVQRQLFLKSATELRQRSLTEISTFEAAQLEKSHDEAWAANKNTTIGTAVSAGTPEAIDSARLEIQKLNRYQAARKGWDGATLENENLKDLTELHRQMLQQLAKKNPAAAKDYFTKYKGDIFGSLRAELGEFAERATAGALGEQAAAEAWKVLGPKTDQDPVNEDQLEQSIRDKLKGNEDAIDAGIKALRQRTNAFKIGRQEREAATSAAVWGAYLKGATLAEIRAMPEFLQLNGAKRAQIEQHIESLNYTKAYRTRLQQQNEEAARRKRNFAAYLRYSNPEVLAKMSEDELINKIPELGEANVERLIKEKRKLDTHFDEARIDQQDFDHVAEKAGLRPYDPSKSEEQRAKLGELKYVIENRIDAEQTQLKRKLTRAEKLEIMRQELNNKVLVDRAFWFDPEVPVALLKPEQMKDAYVEVDGQKVKLADIPIDDRETIIRLRRKYNLPITEEAIARAWLLKQQRKPGDE